MPPRLPTVEDGRLLLPEHPEAPIAVGSPAWVAWLDAPAMRSFAFRSGQGRLTARKDRRQRGGSYWVAYRKLGGTLRNIYLGKSADVTQERLADAAAMLAAAIPPTPPTVPSPADAAASPPATASPLLRTKLYAPPLPQALVSRSRLVARLQTAATCRLTLVVAPAGFGKTTLLGDWLRREGEARPAAGAVRTVWLALDERDNDPVLFWSYVIAALQTIAPGVGASALLILGRRSAPSPPLDQILTVLLNDLAALLDDPAAPDLALVLDDYHVITAPAIHDALAFLLDRLPPRLRLVITSRHDPPLPLARLRVRGQLLELRAADLRFTSTEAAVFLNDVMGLDLTAADVETLEQRTEGWIAGLQLAALSMQEQTDRSGFIRALSGSHRYILDYLIEEVLRQQPGEIQAFLLQTSILDRLSAELCDAVVEPPGGGGSRSAAILD